MRLTMRTTIDIPENIMAEAMRLAGVRSKTTTVILSLQEFINHKKIEKLRALRGKIDLDIDLEALRRNRTTP
jgi:Arc/MetJ family transcription regulator